MANEPSLERLLQTRDEQRRPPDVDTTVASIARAYDATLGGKDNYAVDRDVRDQLLVAAPETGKLAWDNRDFLVRVTRFLAGKAGITQFLDCGSGLPSAENTHQAAQRITSAAHVVYVDYDPIVLAHGRALLDENGQTSVVQADFTDPTALLQHPEVREHIDFDEPVALYHVGTLHHLADEQRPDELVAQYLDALPSGSYFVVSHFYNPQEQAPELAEIAARLEETFLHSPLGTGRFRTREEIAAYLRGLDLVEPGLVTIGDWWPDGPDVGERYPEQNLMLGAVGRKP